jgi:hypothetical protein
MLRPPATRGRALAFFATRTNIRLLAQSLAFWAGVMLYVSAVSPLRCYACVGRFHNRG